MVETFLRGTSSIWNFVKQALDKNIFLRSVVAISIPIVFLVIAGSYVGWDATVVSVGLDLKLLLIVVIGSFLCALDGFWYVRSFSRERKK